MPSSAAGVAGDRAAYMTNRQGGAGVSAEFIASVASLDDRRRAKIGAAVDRLVGKYRSRHAVDAYTRLGQGHKWSRHRALGPHMVPELSRRNIQRLRASLGPLDGRERAFFRHFIETPAYATHFTDANLRTPGGNAALFSRRELDRRGVPFDRTHTTAPNIRHLANDDFIFFSVEFGDRPLKPRSRFGDRLYRFEFDRSAFSDAGWLSMTEQLIAERPVLQKHLRGIPPDDVQRFSGQRIPMGEGVFHGGDMKRGMALSIVDDARRMTPESRARVLNARTPAELNAVLNGLYRPEVKVPRHVFATPVSVTQAKPAPRPLKLPTLGSFLPPALGTHPSAAVASSGATAVTPSRIPALPPIVRTRAPEPPRKPASVAPWYKPPGSELPPAARPPLVPKGIFGMPVESTLRAEAPEFKMPERLPPIRR